MSSNPRRSPEADDVSPSRARDGSPTPTSRTMPPASLGSLFVLALADVAFGGGLTLFSTGGLSSTGSSLTDGDGLLAVGRATLERSSRARSRRFSGSTDADRSVAASVACLAIESSVAEKSTPDATSGEQPGTSGAASTASSRCTRGSPVTVSTDSPSSSTSSSGMSSRESSSRSGLSGTQTHS